jgi:tungstate transport system substrate-binding protein
MLTLRHLIVIAASVVFGVAALAQEKSIIAASTTSTLDSGLFDHILPLFKAKTGIDVRVVAQGTGEALDTGRRGDADVVFVHAKSEEDKFLAEGFGVKRYPVMYNDFVLIGPNSDPAGIKGTKDIVAAFKSLKQKRPMFISRGDRSATHEAELKVWTAAGIGIFRDKELWYNQTGQGMGATLNMASATNVYVLSDRGSWLSFKNKGDLVIVVEGDTRRLAGLGRGPGGNRRLQDQRRATVPPKRQFHQPAD